MRITAISAPDSSGHYRIRQPIRELQRQGVEDLHVVDGLDIVFSKSGAVVDVRVESDIVILQRPLLFFMPGAIDAMHRKGIKVVVELDDDFHTAHGSNLAFQANHPKVSEVQNWNHLSACVRKADLVTVSTTALARRYGSHGRVAILRNYADDDWLEMGRHGDGRTVGWAGTVVNHPTDLEATRGGVSMALADHPQWHFLCVGGSKYVERVQRGLELTKPPEATAWRPLELHPMLVSAIDVGIVPLADLVFNRGKSWLKGLEYAALGIPFVASDLPEYQRLKERYGLGVLADWKAKSWRRRLGAVMEREEMFADYERFSRSQVRQYLTISKNAWRWQEVWETLGCRRQRTRERAAV